MTEYVAVIPAFDAELWIGDLLDAIFSLSFSPLKAVIVVDDGSSDQTSSIARLYPLIVLNHPRNKGKGAALKTGFTVAQSLSCDAVVTLDADGQHDPRWIPDAVRHFEQDENTDILIGKRTFEFSSMPPHRRLSNSVSSLLLSVISGKRFYDSQCGFRIIGQKALSKLNCRTNRFDFESEFLLRAVGHNMRITWHPIPVVYGTEGSHIHPSRDIWNMMRLIGRTLALP